MLKMWQSKEQRESLSQASSHSIDFTGLYSTYIFKRHLVYDFQIQCLTDSLNKELSVKLHIQIKLHLQESDESLFCCILVLWLCTTSSDSFESFWQIAAVQSWKLSFEKCSPPQLQGFKPCSPQSPLYHPPQSFKTQPGFTLADRTCHSSAYAWYSWRSRNSSSMGWSKVGRKQSAHSWQAQAGPRSLAAH